MNRIRPIHLQAVLDEQERQVVLKGWLLDDALPIEDVLTSPVQRFFRTAAQRRWLDAATGDLVTVFVLDTYLGAQRAETSESPTNEQPSDAVIDVLVAERNGSSAFVTATHEMARIFDVRLDELPALVLYTSTASSSFVTVSFRGLTEQEEVKERWATVIHEVRAAATDVFGPTRTAALAARASTEPITADEAERILDRLRGRLSDGDPAWKRWFTVVTSANAIYTLIEHAVKLLRYLAG